MGQNTAGLSDLDRLYGRAPGQSGLSDLDKLYGRKPAQEPRAQEEPDTPQSSGIDTSQVDNVADREGLNVTQRQVMSALLGQESSNGKNTATSTDGARGAGQIMPDTFAQYARPGERIDNPAHNLAVMARIVKDLGNKTGDDPAKMATGYFSGPNNIGTDTPYKRDRADGNRKTVSSYVNDVLGRLSGTGAASADTPLQQPDQEPEQPASAPTSAPDISKVPKWSAVIAKPEFQAMSATDKQGARDAYFQRYIQPGIEPGQRSAYREWFQKQTAQAEAAAKPSAWQSVKNAVSALTPPASSDVPSAGYVDPMTGIDASGGVDNQPANDSASQSNATALAPSFTSLLNPQVLLAKIQNTPGFGGGSPFSNSPDEAAARQARNQEIEDHRQQLTQKSWGDVAKGVGSAALDIAGGAPGFVVGAAAAPVVAALSGDPKKGEAFGQHIMQSLTPSEVLGKLGYKLPTDSPYYQTAMMPFTVLNAAIDQGAEGYAEMAKLTGASPAAQDKIKAVLGMTALAGMAFAGGDHATKARIEPMTASEQFGHALDQDVKNFNPDQYGKDYSPDAMARAGMNPDPEAISPKDTVMPVDAQRVAPTPDIQSAAESAAVAGAPSKDMVDQAAHEAATSPLNDKPQPTDAQIEAGNYQLGHVDLHGLDISIENPQGSVRSGVSPDGKEWSNTLADHYGYLKSSLGADHEHVDAFVGPRPESTKAFVVDQIDPVTGKFDEHKVMLGYDSLEQADAAYHANYEKGWTGRGNITETSVDGLKSWLKDGDTTKPFADLPDPPTHAELADQHAQAIADYKEAAHAGDEPAAQEAQARVTGTRQALEDAHADAAKQIGDKLAGLAEKVSDNQVAAAKPRTEKEKRAARAAMGPAEKMQEIRPPQANPRTEREALAARAATKEKQTNEPTPTQAVEAKAQGPQEPAAAADRRVDADARKRVADMTPDELRAALLTSDKTGIGNERAYNEVNKKPFQASMDVDSLGWVNDNMGHLGGDALLREVGRAFKDVTGDAYHLHGDEFAAHFDTEQAGHDVMAKVRDRLKNAEIEVTLPDGATIKKKGIGFSYGIDKTFKGADARLYEDKAARTAAGDRVAKGQQPEGVLREPAARIENNKSDAAATEVSDAAGGRNRQALADIKQSRLDRQGGGTTISAETREKARQALADVLKTPKEMLTDLKISTVPMSVGSDVARKVAKDYANQERVAQWQWKRFDDVLTKSFDEKQLEKMWNAADEENDLRRDGIKDDARGLGRLDPEERKAVEVMHAYGEELIQRAKEAGMFQGEGVPYWTPRMAVMVGESGEYSRPVTKGEGGGGDVGRNVTTSASSLKQRKYLTSAETEAAMQARLNEGDKTAQLVRNIRTMPMAMARLERAIAGRELINQIKAIGQATGHDTVLSGGATKGDGYFTIDHPAFKTWRPDFDDNGKVRKDDAGNPIMTQVPLKIADEFKGPLKAVLSQKPGAAYLGMMELKSKSMGLIMYSPLIHNAVEWGRAIPAMDVKGKLSLGLYTYVTGNRAKHDPEIMRKFIDGGLVPLGGRGAHMDITGIMDNPTLEVGKSWTAKILAAPVSIISERGAINVKKAVDAAGKFWHETLLWDRVADLQMGLAVSMHASLMNKGFSDVDATYLAAHFANRYAGALPKESMSEGARQILNLALFSRSFTMGNLGAMKDMIAGLPKDVQAQIKLGSGEVALQAAQSVARRKAIATFIMDVGLMYAGNSLLQDWLEREKIGGWKDWMSGYADRGGALYDKLKADPASVLAHPFNSLESLSSTSKNEPGKEERIKWGRDDRGTEIYVRLPTGKIGEEFANYGNFPAGMMKQAHAKLSTFLKPLSETWSNDKGFGQKVYDDGKDASTAKNIGKVVFNFMKAQVPSDQILAAYDLMSGHGDDMDVKKIVGPLVGLTFSKGAPGGPEVGEMYEASREHQDKVVGVMPDVKRALKVGDTEKAHALMESAGMTEREISTTLNHIENPETRINKQAMRNFNRRATDEQKSKMEELRR